MNKGDSDEKNAAKEMFGNIDMEKFEVDTKFMMGLLQAIPAGKSTFDVIVHVSAFLGHVIGVTEPPKTIRDDLITYLNPVIKWAMENAVENLSKKSTKDVLKMISDIIEQSQSKNMSPDDIRNAVQEIARKFSEEEGIQVVLVENRDGEHHEMKFDAATRH